MLRSFIESKNLKHSQALLLRILENGFCSYNKATPKLNNQEKIIDYRALYYKPSQQLEFDQNGRCLLYYYRPRFYTYAFQYSKYAIPFGVIAYLIARNPFYMTFPAALPIMFTTEFILFKRIYELKKHIRYVVGEIYLHKDGETVEIIFQNQLWRKLKADNLANLFYIPSMKTPKEDDQTLPLKGDLFPEIYPFDDTKPSGWAWKKYYRNPRNFLVLPKNANYKNMEILVAIFGGKYVDTSKQYIKEINHNKADEYYYA